VAAWRSALAVGCTALSVSVACGVLARAGDAEGSVAGRSVLPPPRVTASAYVVADASTGAILAERNPHGRYLPASTLKMLTAVALIPRLRPGANVVASARAVHVVPTVAGLRVGHAYRVRSLFAALLTISANDAAVALAEATGSYREGVAAMNETARWLGAGDTVAVDPSGLDARGQHTSAYDLGLIARQALRMPAFMRYDGLRSFRFAVSPGRAKALYNQNQLLTTYPGGIGGKIGWTTAADATYVGMARRHGVTLIVTLLHCPAFTEIDSAEKLLTWGFAADGRIVPTDVLVSPATPQDPLAVPGWNGTSGQAAAAGPAGRPARAAASDGAGGTLTAWSFIALALLVVAGFAAGTPHRRRVASGGPEPARETPGGQGPEHPAR
jgi:serine-type D-Ala-D-Ala carboxypeptidase (penicillin-binding protein 5/6)